MLMKVGVVLRFCEIIFLKKIWHILKEVSHTFFQTVFHKIVLAIMLSVCIPTFFAPANKGIENVMKNNYFLTFTSIVARLVVL